MSEENPFAAPAAGSQRGGNPSRPGWMVAGILAVLLVVAVLLWVTALAKQRSLESLRSQLDDANTRLDSARTESQKDKEQITALQAQVADLEPASARPLIVNMVSTPPFGLLTLAVPLALKKNGKRASRTGPFCAIKAGRVLVALLATPREMIVN